MSISVPSSSPLDLLLYIFREVLIDTYQYTSFKWHIIKFHIFKQTVTSNKKYSTGHTLLTKNL